MAVVTLNFILKYQHKNLLNKASLNPNTLIPLLENLGTFYELRFFFQGVVLSPWKEKRIWRELTEVHLIHPRVDLHLKNIVPIHCHLLCCMNTWRSYSIHMHVMRFIRSPWTGAVYDLQEFIEVLYDSTDSKFLFKLGFGASFYFLYSFFVHFCLLTSGLASVKTLSSASWDWIEVEQVKYQNIMSWELFNDQ